ncbi:RNA methyltransferase, TrmA family [Lachnospiraceae bacterium KM106-2]|nr:RNA methyltransferase, TrmA family [Lachnospiraceae bacterium KM106-2]
MIKKNDILDITIDSLGSEGEGIGRIEGYALFVKDALIGDKVRVKIMKMKKSYGFARLMEVLEPSPYRVEPVCPVARQCGGCQLQHLDYEKQVEYKQDKVKNCLERIGKFNIVMEESKANDENTIFMEPAIGMESSFYYRNKAQFPMGLDKDGNVVTGFYAARSHSIIPTTNCYIQAEVNKELLTIVKDFLQEFGISTYDEENHKGLVRHILTRVGYTTKEIMVCLIINGAKLPHAEELVERLTKIEGMTSICLNVNKEKTNVILGNQVIPLWGQDYITDYIGDIKFQISPLSFYQVNPVQTKELYSQALEYADLTGNEIVWDMYCGIGTISLFLAKKAKKVYGVEIVSQAIEDAKKNAQINEITNAEFFVGAAEEVVPEKYKKDHIKADVVVVDPPRKGCAESLLETIVAMEPKRVVYVSCDPATLARDLRYLADHGFNVVKARAVDMFPNSAHVESVALLERK